MEKYTRLVLLIFALSVNNSYAEEFSFCQTEWPPYSLKSKTFGGYAGAIVNEAMSHTNRTFVGTFYPWPRAILYATTGDECLGFFPAIKCSEDLVSSIPIFDSYIGLAALKGKKNIFENGKLNNGLQIGVVRGQVIPDGIQRYLTNSQSKLSYANGHKQNVQKLSLDRVDAIIIDENVLFYLKVTDRESSGKTIMIRDTLEAQSVVACFSKTRKKELEIFNEGLNEIDTDLIAYDLF